jgi:hypothetical protein
VRVLAEAEALRLAGEFGRTSTADLLSTRLNVSHGQACARVRRAADLAPRVDTDGTMLPPLLAGCADALAAGDVSAAQVDVITRTLHLLPDDIPADTVYRSEAMLLDAARSEEPRLLKRRGDLLLAELDRDGVADRERRREAKRGFTVTADGDGMGVPSGSLTPDVVAGLDVLFDTLAAPRTVLGQDGEPTGEKDTRTATQRRHDALRELIAMVLRSDQLPTVAGVSATILIQVTEDQLADPDAQAVTGHGQLLSVREVHRLVGDAEFMTVVTDSAGAVTRYGAALRFATCPQRRAMAVRDRGCCFPGCDRPPAWCQAHHVVGWQHRKQTRIDSMVLICTHHHRLVEQGHWQLDMINGVPWWKPPAWIDPDRKPLRNHAHHPPKIEFPPLPADPLAA